MCNDSQRKLQRLREVDLKTVEVEKLVDIRNVKINQQLSQPSRAIDFISQIKNPYCYRHGNFVVQISFSDTKITLTERLNEYLKSVVASGI